MTITRYDPFNALAHWQRDMGRLFDNRPRAVNDDLAADACDWTPALDIREVDNAYVIRADLPGVRRDDVDITVDRNVLTIRGKRQETGTNGDGRVLRSERIGGSFHRRLTLPQSINRNDISAQYENGVLEVVLPKGAEAQPLKIAVAG